MIFRGPFSDGYPITDLIFGIQHDISVIRWNKSLALLIVDMEKSLEAITKWLRKSGLKVIDEKTELCLFHRKNQHKTSITIKNI